MSYRFVPLRALLFFLICAPFLGCDSKREAQPVRSREPVAESSAQFPTPNDSPTIIAPWIAEHGQITFDSSVDPSTGDGLRLTLLQDGTATVDYLGSDSASSTGNYRIENRNRLRLDFGVDDPWLPMELSMTDGSLVVNAPEKQQIIELAVQAGIEREDIREEDIQAAFQGWPLRQSTGDEPIENNPPSTQ